MQKERKTTALEISMPDWNPFPRSYELAAGELMLIAGPSGCGKSTLLKCLIARLRGQGRTIVIAEHRVEEANVRRFLG